MASSNTGAETIETPLLKVPYESLKRTTRDRKAAVEEYTRIMDMLQMPGMDSPEVRDSVFDTVNTQLAGLKRKLEEVGAVEEAELRRCQARLQSLAAMGAPQRGATVPWNRARLDRLLADHLLRRGHLATAALLAHDTGIQELVDTHIFEEAQSVAGALDRHDCGPALEWCRLHSAKLKKTRSLIIFNLRLQEFVELVRVGDTGGAIKYARAHLADWAEPCEEEHQRAFAALVFTASSPCPQYKDLFSEERWQELKDLFLAELYRLQSLTPASVLNIHLQAGLAALKVPQSLEEGTNKEDPLHLDDFRLLAADLPFSKHVHSKLVCAITRQRMDEHNPPMVTPKGACYSEAGMQQIADANGGTFVDPVSGDRHRMSEMKRAYIS